MPSGFDTIICGAGIAGISAAYHLSVKYGLRDILLVDEGAPLSLTSDKSTECYRNWWPGPDDAMVSLMNRSIDILEDLANQSGNSFHLNRRGYLYLTADSAQLQGFIQAAQEPPKLGAGELRIHQGLPQDPIYTPSKPEGYSGQPDGADLFIDPGLIHKYFPYLSEKVIAALHVRRAGWFSAQQLGAYLLEKARQNGVRYLNAKITGVEVSQNQVRAVLLGDGTRLPCAHFVNAAGPFLKQVGHLIGIDLPVYSELHLKVAFKDYLHIVPRHAPLLIWSDPQHIQWSPEERSILAEDEDTRWLLDELPAGVHTRPEGGAESEIVLILWEYRTKVLEPVFPPPLDEMYPELALRGLATMLPGLTAYIGKAPRPVLDGGYYTKTRENRPLIGPLPVRGAYVLGALSGFGLMAACAAGELLAAHLTSSQLPPYAHHFNLERYSDPAYQQLLSTWNASGQL